MHRFTVLFSILIASFLFFGCNKGKGKQAIVEEVPSASATLTDSASTLSEEPSLANVDGKKLTGTPNTFHPTSAEGISKTGRFVIQVAVFKSKKQARQAKQKLLDAGLPAYVADVESPTPDLSGTYYRVRIGNFESIPSAHTFGKNLSSQGYSYWVDRKANDHTGDEGGYSTPVQESTPVSEPTYKAPASSEPSAPSTPVSDPVGVPEPPAPSEPTPTQENSWGNPVSDTASSISTPVAPKDTVSGAVEGW